jgi:hypothetical protein
MWAVLEYAGSEQIIGPVAPLRTCIAKLKRQHEIWGKTAMKVVQPIRSDQEGNVGSIVPISCHINRGRRTLK